MISCQHMVDNLICFWKHSSPRIKRVVLSQSENVTAVISFFLRCSSGFDRKRQDWVDLGCPEEVLLLFSIKIDHIRA